MRLDNISMVLHIGEQQTAVTTISGDEPPEAVVLEIGSKKTAAEYFRHHPPTPAEIENAIVAVEDEIARVRSATPATLFTTDDAIRKIALISGVPDRSELILTRDAVERTFERLIAVTLDRPDLLEEIPADVTFAATLLILREFMHHS